MQWATWMYCSRIAAARPKLSPIAISSARILFQVGVHPPQQREVHDAEPRRDDPDDQECGGELAADAARRLHMGRPAAAQGCWRGEAFGGRVGGHFVPKGTRTPAHARLSTAGSRKTRRTPRRAREEHSRRGEGHVPPLPGCALKARAIATECRSTPPSCAAIGSAPSRPTTSSRKRANHRPHRGHEHARRHGCAAGVCAVRVAPSTGKTSSATSGRRAGPPVCSAQRGRRARGVGP